jgi:hypothetical protein
MRSIEIAAHPTKRAAAPNERDRSINPNLKRSTTMIRTTLLAAVLALGTTAAFADNNYTFDDAYWKQAQATQSVQPTESAQTQGKYDLVDRYNP